MPTLLNENGFRFYFYSNENAEPCHVHVEKGDASGKVWLEPKTEVNYFDGFSSAEEKAIINLIKEHSETFKKKWYEFFK